MNLREFRYHWAKGRAFGYPTCCVLRFSWTLATRSGRRDWQAVRRGSCLSSKGHGMFVPCGVFHHARWTWEEWGQLPISEKLTLCYGPDVPPRLAHLVESA